MFRIYLFLAKLKIPSPKQKFITQRPSYVHANIIPLRCSPRSRETLQMAAANSAASKADMEVFLKANLFALWRYLLEITLSSCRVNYISQNAAAGRLFKVKCYPSVI
jgi:hypothetical protein